MVGIQETKEVLLFGLSIAGDTVEAFADDGKIDLTDIPKYTDSLMALPAALVGITEVPAELKDLDEAEFLELKEVVFTHFPDVGDKWIRIAKAAISIGMNVITIINELKKPS